MKKLRLKKWVKVSLILLLLIGIALIGDNIQKKAVNDCVSAGHSYQYCVEGLY